jgi:hypothetical protein
MPKRVNNYPVTTVTPELAKKWLATSVGNRSIDAAKVSLYARMMEQGQWKVDHTSALGIDWNGVLRQGHHRLHAVIQSGLNVKFAVVRGIDPATTDIMDTGKSRTAADVLALSRNVKNSSSVAALINIINHKKSGLKTAPELSRPDALQLFDQYDPQELNRCAKLGKNAAKQVPGLSPKAAALLALDLGDTPKAAEFFKGLISGANLSERDPRLALIKRFRARRADEKRMHGDHGPLVHYRELTEAWNIWAQRTKNKRLPNFNSSSPFPALYQPQ